jgi:hypothetical protein
MKLFCTKCGPVEETLTPIEDGEPMQCKNCLDFTVEVLEEEPTNKVRVFKGAVTLEDYLKDQQ